MTSLCKSAIFVKRSDSSAVGHVACACFGSHTRQMIIIVGGGPELRCGMARHGMALCMPVCTTHVPVLSRMRYARVVLYVLCEVNGEKNWRT